MLDPRFNTCLHAAHSGSMARAAEELFLSKQAVKKQIDSLEAELGFSLFVRSSRGLALTQAGRQWIDGVEQLTDQYHRLADRCRLAQEQAGQKTLTILLPSHPKVYFEETMLSYNRLYPQVRLNIVDTRKLSVLYNDRARIATLTDGTADVVFAPCTESYSKEELVFFPLNRLSYHCVMKPGHPPQLQVRHPSGRSGRSPGTHQHGDGPGAVRAHSRSGPFLSARPVRLRRVGRASRAPHHLLLSQRRHFYQQGRFSRDAPSADLRSLFPAVSRG